jgi:hypothetical protein
MLSTSVDAELVHHFWVGSCEHVRMCACMGVGHGVDLHGSIKIRVMCVCVCTYACM